MKLVYLHPHGSGLLSAPSGGVYAFEARPGDGRRVAEVEDPGDARWFLSLTGHDGEFLFEQLDEVKAEPEYEEFDPARKNYEHIAPQALRLLYRQRLGKAAPPRINVETLAAALRELDEQEAAIAKEAEAEAEAELEPESEGIPLDELEPLSAEELAEPGGGEPEESK